MKKIMTIFMAAAVVMTLAGCGSRTEQEADRRETGQSTSQEESRESSSAQESNSAGSSASSKEDAGIQQGEASVEVSAEASTEASKETAGLRDDYEDNFDVDEEAAAEFGRMIKEAVAQKDVEKLADLTGFPVYVGLSGGIVVETREDFIALDAEELLSDEMVSSIAAADENTLSPSMAGFTLYGSDGAPSITFGVREGSLAISGINYGH